METVSIIEVYMDNVKLTVPFPGVLDKLGESDGAH